MPRPLSNEINNINGNAELIKPFDNLLKFTHPAIFKYVLGKPVEKVQKAIQGLDIEVMLVEAKYGKHKISQEIQETITAVEELLKNSDADEGI